MRKFSAGIAAAAIAAIMMIQPVSAARLLIPGGQVIGLELRENRVTVEGFDGRLGETARAAGLKEGDWIVAIDGKPIHCADDVRQALRSSDGDVDLSVVRGSAVKELELEPAITEDGPKLGVYLRQGITGIGTVT